MVAYLVAFVLDVGVSIYVWTRKHDLQTNVKANRVLSEVREDNMVAHFLTHSTLAV